MKILHNVRAISFSSNYHLRLSNGRAHRVYAILIHTGGGIETKLICNNSARFRKYDNRQ